MEELVAADIRSQLTRPSAPAGFSEAELDGLPPAVRRHLQAAIVPGTPLATSTRLRMRGQLKLGRWLPFRAEQVLAPHQGFHWAARVAGVISGFDQYLDGRGELRWKLLGLVPVMRANGPDVARSAVGRVAGEAMWLPTALLPRFGVEWEAADHQHITARFSLDGSSVDLHYSLEEDGRISSVVFNRWGDPDLLVANAAGGRRFGAGDIQLTETFAQQAAVAVEHARLQQELDRLAVLEDRERIAKELHDGVIQALFAVGLGLQGSAMLARDADLQRRIGGAVEELDRVIGDLRNYIFGLRPGILADRQLDQALRRLGEELEQKTGVVTVVEVDPAAAAALAEAAAEVVQLAREALANVSRHAQATTCRMSLYRDGAAVVLEVDDDGQGFDPVLTRPSGQGLRNLGARAEALGGQVEIDSRSGEGTRVRIQLTRPSLPTSG